MPLYTLKYFAELSGFHPQTISKHIREHVKSGKLKRNKAGTFSLKEARRIAELEGFDLPPVYKKK